MSGRPGDGNAVPPDGEAFLIERVAVLGRMLSTLAAHGGLSDAQWLIVSLLAVAPPATVEELAGRLSLDAAEAGHAVIALARDGHVERRPCPRDKRRMLLSLTERGHVLYDRLLPAEATFCDALTSGLDAEARLGMERALAALAAACAERLGPQGGAPRHVA